MSHGTHDDIARRHALVRQVEDDVGRPIGILADLQGPKLRCGTFANGPVHARRRARAFRFDLDTGRWRRRPGSACRIRRFSRRSRPGSTLLVNDGKIRLKVTECSPKHALTEVIVGGEISNRKGVNVPDVVLPLAALSEKDKKDLEFACELGVDWLALSFVQRAERRVRGARARRRPGGDPRRRSRSRRRSTPSPRSSRPRTASWSRAATSASSCRFSRCRRSRSG